MCSLCKAQGLRVVDISRGVKRGRSGKTLKAQRWWLLGRGERRLSARRRSEEVLGKTNRRERRSRPHEGFWQVRVLFIAHWASSLAPSQTFRAKPWRTGSRLPCCVIDWSSHSSRCPLRETSSMLDQKSYWPCTYSKVLVADLRWNLERLGHAMAG